MWKVSGFPETCHSWVLSTDITLHWCLKQKTTCSLSYYLNLTFKQLCTKSGQDNSLSLQTTKLCITIRMVYDGFYISSNLPCVTHYDYYIINFWSIFKMKIIKLLHIRTYLKINYAYKFIKLFGQWSTYLKTKSCFINCKFTTLLDVIFSLIVNNHRTVWACKWECSIWTGNKFPQKFHILCDFQ